METKAIDMTSMGVAELLKADEGLAHPLDPDKTKLAQRIAEQIERDIVDLGWPVGRILGLEADLQKRYRASRAAMREAIRILEQQGVAEMRRGPRGGLVVTSPARQAVAQSLATYLEFSSVRTEQIQETLDALRALWESRTHTQSNRPDNPALNLFIDMLSRVRTQNESVSGAATERLQGKKRLKAASKDRQALPSKLADTVARALLHDIQRHGRQPGYNLGSESELLQSLGVSRAAFREAVRLLERYNVARMRPGPGGGLIVSTVSPRNAVASAVRYLVYMKLAHDDYIEVRTPLEASAAAAAAAHLSAAESAELGAAYDRLLAAPPDKLAASAAKIHILIGRLSRNPATAMLVQILITLTVSDTLWKGRDAARNRSILLETHRRIVEAIQARDPLLAKKRISEHLEAVAIMDQAVTRQA